MTKKKTKLADLKTFDMAEHLDSEQAIAEYLTIVLEENDPAALAGALGTVARARGMTQVAEASGVTREALVEALDDRQCLRKLAAPPRGLGQLQQPRRVRGWKVRILRLHGAIQGQSFIAQTFL